MACLLLLPFFPCPTTPIELPGTSILEGQTQKPDDIQLHQTDTESPTKAEHLLSSSLDGRLPSRAMHPSSSDPARPEPNTLTNKTQDNHHSPDNDPTRSVFQEARTSRLGVETDPTQAQGDNWDEDFEYVDDEALNPANYPDEQSEEEGEDPEEDEDEETIAVYINLAGKMEDDDEGGAAEEAIESVEREEPEPDPLDGETRDEREGTESQKTDSESSEEHGEQSGEEKDEKRFGRSMSPSPEPSPVKG